MTSLLPACPARRDYWPSEGVYFCANPRVHTRNNLVTVGVCRYCPHAQEPAPEEYRPYPFLLTSERIGACLHLGDQLGVRECAGCSGHVQVKVYACSHPAHRETTIRDCERCIDYERRLGKESRSEWAIGALLAIGDNESPLRTRSTMARLGWPSCHIFVDGPLPDGCSHEATTDRDLPLGIFPHWYLALAELYLRQPRADVFLLLRIDHAFSPLCRQGLEELLWPTHNAAFIGIRHNPSQVSRGCELNSVKAINDLEELQGWCFPGFAIRSLLTDRSVVGHRMRGHNADAGIGMIHLALHEWIRQVCLPAFVVTYHTS